MQRRRWGLATCLIIVLVLIARAYPGSGADHSSVPSPASSTHWYAVPPPDGLHPSPATWWLSGIAASGPTAPRTFLNQEIGRDRRVAFVATELQRLKAARGDRA